MNLIACTDLNGGLGLNGNLLFHIPEDLKRFRKMTSGKIVVMGRKTLESLPGAKPLPNRTNIVLSRGNIKIENAEAINSVGEFLKKYDAQNNPDVFVIGGAQIYQALTPYCKYAYITRVEETRPSDAYIKDFDNLENFVLAERSSTYEYEGLKYAYYTYENTGIN